MKRYSLLANLDCKCIMYQAVPVKPISLRDVQSEGEASWLHIYSKMVSRGPSEHKDSAWGTKLLSNVICNAIQNNNSLSSAETNPRRLLYYVTSSEPTSKFNLVRKSTCACYGYTDVEIPTLYIYKDSLRTLPRGKFRALVKRLHIQSLTFI